MDDLISRQQAIEAIEHKLAEPSYQHTGEDWAVGLNIAESELYDLPSVQPERKKGKWVVDPDGFLHCSNCKDIPTSRIVFKGEVIYDMTPIKQKMKFCPNCGADMRGKQE